MWFVSVAVKNVLRRRFRSSLTVVGLAIAIAAMVALVGIADGFEEQWVGIYHGRGIDLVVIRKGNVNRTAGGLDASFGDKIRALPGVVDVNGGMVDVFSLEKFNIVSVIVNGWEPQSNLFHQVDYLTGGPLKEGDAKKLMLGKTLASSLGKKVGDTLTLFEGEDYEVTAVFESFSVFENGSIVMLLGDLQRLMNRENQVTGFTVNIAKPHTPEQVAAMKAAIEALDPTLSAMYTENFVRTTREIRLAKGVAWMTSVVAFLIGAIGMLNTMVMSVYERTREIGILRAIGWRARRIVEMIMLESVLLSIAGSILGTLFAIAIVRFLSQHPAVAGLIHPKVTFAVILQALFIGISIGVVGSLIPAYQATRQAPTTCLHVD